MSRPATGMRRLFTSESVTEGHPDKVADQISDAVLDAALSRDSEVSSGVRDAGTAPTSWCSLAKSRFVPADDEIDYEAVARKTIRDIGYGEMGGRLRRRRL